MFWDAPILESDFDESTVLEFCGVKQLWHGFHASFIFGSIWWIRHCRTSLQASMWGWEVGGHHDICSGRGRECKESSLVHILLVVLTRLAFKLKVDDEQWDSWWWTNIFRYSHPFQQLFLEFVNLPRCSVQVKSQSTWISWPGKKVVNLPSMQLPFSTPRYRENWEKKPFLFSVKDVIAKERVTRLMMSHRV